MGPHGLCIGATGSGKSELLRTLVTALALSHPPEDLSMILVDYKGGAAFAPLSGLPHIAGLIDNLADDPQLTGPGPGQHRRRGGPAPGAAARRGVLAVRSPTTASCARRVRSSRRCPTCWW